MKEVGKQAKKVAKLGERASMSPLSPNSESEKLTKEQKKEQFEEAWKFFGKNTGTVEVNFNGILERVYFPLPPAAHHLNEEMQEKFLQNVDRTTTKTKLNHLINNSANMI